MPFTDVEVVIKQLGDERWEIVEPVVYKGNRDTFTVGPGFQTDLASVPRPLVWLIPTYGRYTKAAILHDHLCGEARAGKFNRYDADGIFRRSMRELGVAFLRRWIMWAAVRVGSGSNLIRPGIGQFLLVLLIALPMAGILLVPVVFVLTALGVFWLLELLFFLILKPVSTKKQVNRPKLLWNRS